MSQPRFAPITASLLARKGEARPWEEPGKKPLAWELQFVAPKLSPEPLPRLATGGDIPPTPQQWKKCAVRISLHDYERLGLLAVKNGTTRQHLLQDAVETLFTGVTRQFANSCACLGRE